MACGATLALAGLAVAAGVGIAAVQIGLSLAREGAARSGIPTPLARPPISMPCPRAGGDVSNRSLLTSGEPGKIGGNETQWPALRVGPILMVNGVSMIRARVHGGRIELQEPIPESWEGQMVKILPLEPEDPLPDLDRLLKVLHDLGPMEFEPGERERIEGELKELNRVSREAMGRILGGRR